MRFFEGPQLALGVSSLVGLASATLGQILTTYDAPQFLLDQVHMTQDELVGKLIGSGEFVMNRSMSALAVYSTVYYALGWVFPNDLNKTLKEKH